MLSVAGCKAMEAVEAQRQGHFKADAAQYESCKALSMPGVLDISSPATIKHIRPDSHAPR